MNSLYRPSSPVRGFDTVREQIDQMFRGLGVSAAMRASGTDHFPRVNVGATEHSFEITAFAPGLDTNTLQVEIAKDVLSISAERVQSARPGMTAYATERPTGKFARSIGLPPEADPDRVTASYVDGCLNVSVAKRESSQPRLIEIQ